MTMERRDRDYGEFQDWPESKMKEGLDALRYLIEGGFEEDLIKDAFIIAGLESGFDPAAKQKDGLGRGLLQIDMGQWDPLEEGTIWPSEDGTNPTYRYLDNFDQDTSVEGVMREHPIKGDRYNQRRPMLRDFFKTKSIDREEYQQPWKDTTDTIYNPIANARYARDNIYQSQGEKYPWRAFTSAHAVQNLKGLHGEKAKRDAEAYYRGNDLLKKESALEELYENIAHHIPTLYKKYSPNPIKELGITPSELGFRRTGFK